jgi:hypothetical protein
MTIRGLIDLVCLADGIQKPKDFELELQGGYRYVADMVRVVNAFTCKRLLCAVFWVFSYLPMCEMEQTGCFETLVFKLQTPVNHPEVVIQHSNAAKV